jgi:hypothetical protein
MDGTHRIDEIFQTLDRIGTHRIDEIFQTLDRIADQDPIYCAGVESAPLFKKKMQQCFSFNSVPLTSPVRQNPNEYLIDK